MKIKTKAEARTFVQDKVESSVVVDFLRDYLRKTLLVHRWILTLVLRKRFLKKRASIAKLQRLFRVCLAKNVTRKKRTALKEKERRRRMEIFTRLHKD